MDNKRKGSNPQQSPSASGRPEWDESSSRDNFSFADDDDDGPLPAPPAFDNARGAVPELLDGEEVIDEPIDESDLLESAPSDEPERRPAHASPPPLPGGRAGGFHGFQDDGEIALPPRMSHAVQSFPFRKVRAEANPDEVDELDELDGVDEADEADEADDVDNEPEELDPDDLESVTDGVVPGRGPADTYDLHEPARPVDPLTRFQDDDEPAIADPATGTGARWSFTDVERPAASSATWHPDDQAVDAADAAADRQQAARSDMYDRSAADTGSAARLTAVGRAHMFADNTELSAETLADAPIVSPSDDDTGLFTNLGDNTPTGLFARNDMSTTNPGRASLPNDDDDRERQLDDDRQSSLDPVLQLPLDDDAPPPRRPSHGAPVDDDDATVMFSARRLRDVADSMVHAPAQLVSDDDDDNNNGWVHARGLQPSSAIPVANIDDDDDATWDLPPTPTASNASAASTASIASASTSIASVRGDEDTIAQDGERSIGGWIATRPGASMASGIIAVDDFDDDVWPQPAPPTQAQPARDDHDHQGEQDDQGDDDDEWDSQVGPAIGLAPPPTDLGDPFPLDLWSDPDELLGRELGGCRLERVLSRGMVTRVYLGEQQATGRRVAVRVLSPTYSPAEARARQFLYEAQQLMKLRNEHIVEVLGAGTTSDHLTYYVMEYLGGETLASALRGEGPMFWADVAAFANQICDALILAGERGIAHNDLNTTTCMRLPGEPARSDGERPRAVIKLLDVGITPLTSVYRNTDGVWALSQGTPVGAAEFMAPEIAGGGPPDARTAAYAVGILMYELTTGRPPFRGDSFISVLKKQMYEEAVPPRLIVPEQEIPEVFEAVVLRTLAKAPDDRYHDLRALDDALLAARAREGELRRVTQILALDPALWDEDGSRRVKQPGDPVSPPVSTPAPAPFTADIKQRPAQAPRPERPSREPSMALHLTQLAAPIVAPALPAIQVMPTGQQGVIVLSRPELPRSNFVRNVSVAIVFVSLLVMGSLWVIDRNRAASKANEVAAETRRATNDKPRTRAPRETRPRIETIEREPPTTVLPAPSTVPAPPPEPEPEVQQAPPPEPEPTKPIPAVVLEPEPEPEPIPAIVPEPKPEPKPEPIKPKPTPVVVPPAVKPPPPAKKPAKSTDPLDDRPESITKGRLQAKLKSMEPRVASRCRSKAGVPDPSGISVPIKVVVDVRGEVKATTMGAFAGTPMGQCVEEVLEAIRFNETRSGGSHSYTFKL